jgi:hemolysin activation/secretion protein
MAERSFSTVPMAGASKFISVSSLIAALAATAPIPASAQQSVVANPTREELEPVAPAKEQRKSKLTVDGDVERAPCALDDPAYAQIKVNVTSAVFNNLGPVPASALAETYQQYLGSEQPISVVCQIRDAAATKLRTLGYIAAVQVPTQRIEGGAVKFEVLYAKLTSIRVVGKAGRNEKLIESYLSRLADGQLFNRFKAERYLLLARDIPGYDVRLSLKPAGSGAGEMIGEVTLKYTPVTIDFSAQNLSSPSTGRIGGQLRATFNGLTGMGDRTSLSFYSTGEFREQQILTIGHDILVGRNGLKIGGRFTHAWTAPDLGTAVPDIRARTLYANLEASYPVVRKQAFTVRAAAGLDFVNQPVRFAGAPLSEDRLRVGYLRLDMDGIDLKGIGPGGTIGWRLTGSLEARKGLNIFGTSPNCIKSRAVCLAPGFVPPSLPDGDPLATVFRLSAMVELRPLRHVIVSISPRAQTSSAGLLAFEQYSAGNYTIGRGYEPGTIAGDKGAGFQTEIKLDSFKIKPTSSFDLQPYLFVDNAWVWDRAAPTGRSQNLNSLGGGVRIGIGGRARLDLSAGVPRSILPGETKRRDPRFLASFSMNLFPWRSR